MIAGRPAARDSALAVLVRLISFLRPFAAQSALSILLSAATVASSIGLLGTSAFLIASAALHPSVADLQVAIVGVRFFGITRGLFRYAERLLSHWVNFSLLARLRGWFYRALEPLAPARLQDTHSGDLLGRITAGIDTLENFYVRAVAPPVSAVLITVGMAWFTGRWDPRLGLVLAGGMLLAGVGLPLLSYRLGRAPGKRLAILRADLSAALVDGIQGLSDALAYGQAAARAETVSRLGEETGRAQLRLVLAGAAGEALSLLVTNLTLLLVLAVAIPLVSGGQLDGVLLSVLALLTLASFEAVAPLPQAGQQLESSLAAARQLFAVVYASPAVSDPAAPLPLPPAFHLAIRSLTFRYRPDDVPALQDFHLDLPPGKRVAVVGASGAGKTTLLSLLLRFREVEPDRITLNGRDLRCYAAADVRRRTAYIAQSTYLFAATLRQNLSLANPSASEEQMRRALSQAGLEEWLASLPEGLDAWPGEHGAQLSGGERQRLAFARAVLQDASLYLLDEPTAHLDALTERALMAVLETLTRGRSLLLVTHRLTGLDWLDEIIVLDQGRVIERGSHAQLLALGGEYARLLQIQNRDLPG